MPATVVIVPSGAICRTRGPSPKRMLPFARRLSPLTQQSSAAIAGPPSPEKPERPIPATRVIDPSRRRTWSVSSPENKIDPSGRGRISSSMPNRVSRLPGTSWPNGGTKECEPSTATRTRRVRSVCEIVPSSDVRVTGHQRSTSSAPSAASATEAGTGDKLTGSRFSTSRNRRSAGHSAAKACPNHTGAGDQQHDEEQRQTANAHHGTLTLRRRCSRTQPPATALGFIHHAGLGKCRSGAALPPSGHYSLALPAEPRGGAKVATKVSPGLAPGATDRFTVPETLDILRVGRNLVDRDPRLPLRSRIDLGRERFRHGVSGWFARTVEAPPAQAVEQVDDPVRQHLHRPPSSHYRAAGLPDSTRTGSNVGLRRNMGERERRDSNPRPPA